MRARGTPRGRVGVTAIGKEGCGEGTVHDGVQRNAKGNEQKLVGGGERGARGCKRARGGNLIS